MPIRDAIAGRPRWLWLLLLGLLTVALVGVVRCAAAQPAAGDGETIAGEIAQLKHRVKALTARKDMDAGVRKQAVKIYQQAISTLQSAQSQRQTARQFRQDAATAPSDLSAVQNRIHNLKQPRPSADLRSLSAAKLGKRADDLSARLADAQSELSDLRDRLTRLAQRPDAARAALAQARDALQSLASRGSANPNESQASAVNNAQRALLAARRAELNARIARLQQELSSLDSRERLLEAKRSLAEARVTHLNRSLAAVQTALGHKQHASARSLKQQSENKIDELRGAPAPLDQAAQRNFALANELTAVTRASDALAARRAKAKDRVNALDARLNLVQRELEIAEGSVALGDVLRAQKRHLASPPRFFSFNNNAQDVPNIAAADLQRFQLQQKRSALDNPAALADELAKQAGVKLDSGQRSSLLHLLRQRRAIIDTLISAQGRYVNIGRDLGSLSQQYNDTLTSFNQLLNERLFWLPSFHMPRLDWPAQVAADVPWALNPAAWQRAGRALVAGTVARPYVAGPILIAVLLLLGVRRPLRARLKQLREPVGNVRRDTFWLTLRAALVTVQLVLPSVLFLLLAGYLMGQAPGAGRFTQAAAVSVGGLGVLAAFIEPFVHVCRANGLADGHFQWPSDARRGLYRSLRWLLALLVLPTLFVTLTEAFDDDSKRQTIGRAAFMVSSLIIAGFSWRLLYPKGGVLAGVLGADNKSYWRLGYLWLPLAFGIPIALCGLAGWGYYYTALQIQTRFFYSAALLGGCMILYSMIARWLTVAERRLALARALRKRAEAREARAAREAAAASGDSAPDSLDYLEIDLVQISEQTRGLIQLVTTLAVAAGLWLIWSDMLPALRLLNDVTLWHHSSRINGQIQLSNVTLGALLLALAVAVITVLAGRNLPGFLEITLLRRFSLKAGSRYAMATLFQYAIMIIGLLAAVGIVGLRWSSIQWLVAAIGVGLGFGLQQIFANFISGILILFERPVRVGDTVTVGNLTGTVSRIRIRATTITDWDNKEVVIPNQTFITETVINWTLTDDVTRLIVRVRLAFDTDTDLAEKLVKDAIRAEPLVLDEPASSVFLVGYDDSALIYEARVFYNELYNMLPLQHALYKRIHGAFAEHNVEVSFPQQDLHLRSVDPSFATVFGADADKRGSDG